MRGESSFLWLGAMFVCAIGDITVPAQAPRQSDALQPLDFMIGRWTGSSEGQPGKGMVQREYSRVLNARFIRVENRSVYPPQDRNPNGEVHEDVGMISFDRMRGRAVLRQFHVEGFVNQYAADLSGDRRTFVFDSEVIENVPAGFRARETYRFVGVDEFEETFELAEPGKDFEVYARTRLKRAP